MTKSKALISVFLLSLAVLLMEICLTRVFSVLSWHHFAYLIISLALLGFGAAGSYLTVARQFSDTSQDPARLGHFAWLFAVTAIGSIVLASKIRFYPEDITAIGDYSNALSLMMMYVIMGIPFFFAGVCIGRLVAMAGENINQVYFADLFGAGLGALASLAVVNSVGAVAGIMITAALAALAACILGANTRWQKWAYVLTLIGAVALVPATAFTRILPLYYPPSKELFRQEHAVAYSRWHVIGKIDISKPQEAFWSFGGALARRYTEDPPTVMGIYQDGAAPTGIMCTDQKPEDVAILGEYLQGVAYTFKPASKALIIGVGGGIDGLIALHYGSQDVTGVDINPVTVRAVSDVFRDKCQALWQSGKFRMETAEGRHYLTRTGEQFDVIQLSGVDTFTALSSGAYALSENYLYTLEAMSSYWQHLADDGVLSFSRWLFDPPRETLRLVTTQLEMLDAEAVADPSRHFVIMSGPAYHERSPWAETLLKRSEFTPEEVQKLTTWAEERGFTMIYDPFTRRDNRFDEFIQAGRQKRQELVASYVFNVRPTSDDDPFFFDFYRWSSVFKLASGKSGLAGSTGGYGITRMPLGLIILAVSLVQIVVLSVFFILAPLGMQKRLRTHGRGRFGVFLYFAALGLAFISIEIALLQKLSVFVGGPVYSMAITLAAILVFSGIGSFLAKGFARRPGAWLVPVIVGIIAAAAGEVWFLNTKLDDLMGLPLHIRWLVAAAATLPIGLLMGMPFPTGMRIVERIDESVRPWAWGINSCTTVLGSMLCVLLSMQKGFTFTIAAACCVYAIGGLGMAWAVWRNRKGATSA